MFRGITSATLDAKGRMALPTRLRAPFLERAAGQVVVTIDVRERCLLLYPLPDWEAVQRALEGLSNIDDDARLLQRLLIGHATDLELDGNCRILLPAMLREYARLEKPVVLVGQGNKVEIWAESAWHERMDTWLADQAGGLAEAGAKFTGLSV